MRTGEVKRRNCAFFARPSSAAARSCGIAAQRFRADVGGKELRMALFETEVGGAAVAVERSRSRRAASIDGEQRVFVAHGHRPGRASIAGSGMSPRGRAKSSSQSKPHSTGRTMRLVSRVVSAVSHANMAPRVELPYHYTYRSGSWVACEPRDVVCGMRHDIVPNRIAKR